MSKCWMFPNAILRDCKSEGIGNTLTIHMEEIPEKENLIYQGNGNILRNGELFATQMSLLALQGNTPIRKMDSCEKLPMETTQENRNHKNPLPMNNQAHEMNRKHTQPNVYFSTVTKQTGEFFFMASLIYIYEWITHGVKNMKDQKLGATPDELLPRLGHDPSSVYRWNRKCT